MRSSNQRRTSAGRRACPPTLYGELPCNDPTLYAPPPTPRHIFPTTRSTATTIQHVKGQRNQRDSPEATQLVVRRPCVVRVEAAAEVVVEVRADLAIRQQVRVDPGEVAKDSGARNPGKDSSEGEPVARALPPVLRRRPRLILRRQLMWDPSDKRKKTMSKTPRSIFREKRTSSRP